MKNGIDEILKSLFDNLEITVVDKILNNLNISGDK